MRNKLVVSVMVLCLLCSVPAAGSAYGIDVRPAAFEISIRGKDREKIKLPLGCIEISNTSDKDIILKKIRTSCSSCLEVVKEGLLFYVIKSGSKKTFPINIIPGKLDEGTSEKSIYLEFKGETAPVVIPVKILKE